MPEKTTVLADSQLINMMQMCLQKTDLTFNRNLTLPHKAEALEKGSLIHDMLEYYRKALVSGLPYDKAVEIGVRVGRYQSVNLEIDIELTEQVIYQFEAYCEYWKDDVLKPVYVEHPFAKLMYEDDNVKIIGVGRIDAIYKHPHEDPIMRVMDTKSSSRNKAPEELSNQFLMYAWASDTTIIYVDKVGFQKTLKPEERFKRVALSYPKSFQEIWLNNTIWWVLNHYLPAARSGQWPMNLTSCDKYGGCIFRELCKSSTQEARDWKMKTQYQVREPWDPTKQLEDGVDLVREMENA